MNGIRLRPMPNFSVSAVHSAYSDPGPYAELLRALPGDPASLSAAARNVIAHYRAELPDLPEERRGEINSRWLSAILALDQRRHGRPLSSPRALAERVAGCCRDHTLFVVGGLREHGIPARSRVGFAGYFTPGYFHDHVIVEYVDGDRWVRIDPEVEPGRPDAPFATAAEVWRGYRAGELDPRGYGVFPGSELAGPDFIRTYVIFEVAHRFGGELLLWDSWGATGAPTLKNAGDEALIDELAELLVRADGGDDGAEAELVERYRRDDRLHPGDEVTQHSPYGYPPTTVRVSGTDRL